MLPSEKGGAWLSSLEEVGVIAAFSQLHDNVQQSGAICTPIDRLNILLKQSRVVLLLHLTHPNLEDGFLLGGKPLLHVTFEAA